jgi:phosphomannomutase
MIPWLLVASLLSRKNVTLSSLVRDCKAAYPVSGEINSVVADPDAVIARIEKQFQTGERDYTDGLSVSFPEYRFNIRKSNTEPLLRLNVESRGNIALLDEKTEELLQIIKS